MAAFKVRARQREVYILAELSQDHTVVCVCGFEYEFSVDAQCVCRAATLYSSSFLWPRRLQDRGAGMGQALNLPWPCSLIVGSPPGLARCSCAGTSDSLPVAR
ncbi:unnamed protein product [Pleuronectes platessa]|uniref:Uncharacterized protein n=1 Tax=Pleuronectes platessa TaxID=8262 RepID=A0A9N7U7P1_PLEPL|nr:unnamed protein product [Pleuronectes platessa]